MGKTNYKYRAGILNRRDNWEWQGYVIAKNLDQANKLMQWLKKKIFGKNFNKYSVTISTDYRGKTKEKIGTESV